MVIGSDSRDTGATSAARFGATLDSSLWVDLATTFQLLEPGRAASVVVIDDRMHDDAGNLRLGVLATVVDTAAGGALRWAVMPDTTTTADLTLHRSHEMGARPGPLGSVVVDATVVRIGSRLMFVRTKVHDALGKHADELLDSMLQDPDVLRGAPTLAVALVTFLRIPFKPTETVASFAEAEATHRIHWGGTTPARLPLHDRLGLRHPGIAGVIEMTEMRYHHNPNGAIMGGVYGCLLEAAAQSACPGLVATDLDVHFVAPARQHDLRATASIVRSDAHHALCSVDTTETVSGTLLCTGSVALGRTS